MDSIAGIFGNRLPLRITSLQSRGWIKVAVRALAAILMSIWAAHIYHLQDYSQKGSSGHLRSELDLIESINHGHFLIDYRTHDSSLKNMAADYGALLLLADRALIDHWLSRPVVFNSNDAYSLQLVAVIASLILLFVSDLPLSLTLLAGGVLLGAYSMGIFDWDINDRWIPVITNLLTLLLLSKLTSAACRPISLRLILRISLFSIILGLLFSMRAEGRYVLSSSLFFLAVAHVLFMGFKQIRPGRPATGPLLSTFKPDFRVLISIFIVFASLAIVPQVLMPLNLTLFEKIEHVSHRPPINQHVAWHPLYLGLGSVYHDFNYENIVWNDNSSYTQGTQFAPWIKDFEIEVQPFETALKERYFQIFREYPTLFWTGLKYKTHSLILNTYNRLVEERIFIPFIALTAALIFLAMQALSLIPFQFFSLVGSIAAGLGAAAAMSILTTPGTSPDTFYSFLIFGAVLIPFHLWRATLDSAKEPDPSDGRRFAGWISFGVAISATLLLSILLWHVHSTRKQASELFDHFARGRSSYLQMLSTGNPSSLAESFNQASPLIREALARRITTEPVSIPVGTIRLINGSKHYRILNSTWVRNELFLVIENLTPSDEFKYIPIFADSTDPNVTKRYPYFKNNVLLLPTSGFGKGIWMFHCLVNSSFARRILIGDIQYHWVDFAAYDRPISPIAYEILNKSGSSVVQEVAMDPRLKLD